VVVGCSSQKNTENPDKQVAEECVNKIDSIAKGKSGTVNHLGIRKEDGVVARAGGVALKKVSKLGFLTWKLPFLIMVCRAAHGVTVCSSMVSISAPDRQSGALIDWRT
jgi:hypothetical protein